MDIDEVPINAETKAGGNETHKVVVVHKNDEIYGTYYDKYFGEEHENTEDDYGLQLG